VPGPSAAEAACTAGVQPSVGTGAGTITGAITIVAVTGAIAGAGAITGTTTTAPDQPGRSASRGGGPEGSAMTTSLALPHHPVGRLCARDQARYDRALKCWCAAIVELGSRLEFKVSARGWCYVLEEHGLKKVDFDRAESLINKCRKSGLLPLDICSIDEGRVALHVEDINTDTPEEFAADWFGYLQQAHEQYQPISFWDDLGTYVQMTTEKVDLRSLFDPVCEGFHIPLSNVSGWNDINNRAAFMRRFQYWERRGKRCVLLHCGDHDPGGLRISDFIRSNLQDLVGAVGWSPDNLVVDRFGLNADFIERHRLTWIDNLATGASRYPLDDSRHPDRKKKYVQSYLREFGARKVEANALVVRPEAGRRLCRDAILKYVPATAVADFQERLEQVQAEAHAEILELLRRT
jgi:hypothetical protein